MALVLKDRVRETTATIGTGAITVSGAAVRHQTFAAAGVTAGSTFPYAIEVPSGPWETGTGTYNADGTISRALGNSSTGALLSLTGEAGTTISLSATASAFSALAQAPSPLTVTVVAASGSAQTLAAPGGPNGGSSAYDVTLTASCTFSLSGGVAGQVQSIMLFLRQDATAGRVATLPAGVKWAGGAAPTPNTAAGSMDVFMFFTPDAGVTWFGSY